MGNDYGLTAEQTQRLSRAQYSLQGLAVGDAFGETFFAPTPLVEERLATRTLDEPPWSYTDDTEMALSLYAVLRAHGQIEQDALARSFAAHYDPMRGYGPAMHRLLREFAAGGDWRQAAGAQFGGQGSYGNGAAMRVGVVGAYFADDLPRVVEQATRSALVTHTHPEAVAGATAVAVAAALAWQGGQAGARPTRAAFLDQVLGWVPDSEVRGRLRQARDMAPSATVPFAVAVLGNGTELSAQDTVPFALWCAAGHLDSYEAALWQTVSGLGDRDTTCAIVGSIVALYDSGESIPQAWRAATEPLPAPWLS